MKNWFKALIGSIAFVAWLLVFCVGLFVDAVPFVEKLKTELAPDVFIAAMIAFTPTNMALLTCLASLVGGCASNLVYAKSTKNNIPPTLPEETVFFLTENPAASMLRGFAVYLAFLAGIYITSNQPFDPNTADRLARANQYARIAGTVSLIAFVVGYDPTLFRRFISMLPKGGHTGP
jgi:hypothetical protein